MISRTTANSSVCVGGRLVAAELVGLNSVATGGGLLGLGNGQEHLSQKGGREETHFQDLREGGGQREVIIDHP